MFTLEEVYNQGIKIIRNLVEDIRFGRQLYLKPVETFSSQIFNYLNDVEKILTLVNCMQDKNPYMYSHPVNVALISYVIGRWLNMDQTKLKNLICAGLLHDIGKAKIKDGILNKEDALTLDEVEKLKVHSVIGYKLVSSVNMFNIQVLQAVLFHHERMDGSGYPLGLKGDKINVYSRIIAIADTFDAITATKAYHKKDTPLKALEEIQESSLCSLDTNICEVFIHKLINYYKGREVRLNNELVGTIVRINPEAIAKPIVCCEKEYHDLSVEKEIEIVDIF